MVVGERTSAAAMMAGANGGRRGDWVREGLESGRERMNVVDVDEWVKLIEGAGVEASSVTKARRLDA